MDCEIPGHAPTREESLRVIEGMMLRASDEQLAKLVLDLEARSPSARKFRDGKGTAGPGKVYGYCRISALLTQDRSLGIDSQKACITQAFEEKFAPEGYSWGGFFVDPDTSGERPIDERQAGRALCLRVMPGDIVVCLCFDRLFRSLPNGVFQMNLWANRDIGAYSVRDRLEFSKRNPEGQLFVYFMSLIAQWERHFISVRCREAKAIAKAQGRAYTPHVPPGFKLVGPRGKRKVVVDWHQQRTIDHIVHMREVQAMTFEQIERQLRRDGDYYETCRLREGGHGYYQLQRPWPRTRIYKAYMLRKKNGRPGINEDPGHPEGYEGTTSSFPQRAT